MTKPKKKKASAPGVGAYTETVIEHFKTPHNYGKMDNPDGTGKVGNVVCVLPEEKIHLQNEIQPLGELRAGERVLSHTGYSNAIERAVSTMYDGKIIELKDKLGTVNLTPEHLVYAIKPPKGDKFLRTKYRKQLMPAWYHSAHLKKGDIVLYPIQRDVKKTGFIEINIPREKYDFKSVEIPKKIRLSENILKMFGYFLAEGSISEGKCRNFVLFTLNIKETYIVEDLKKAAKELNLTATVRKMPERKTVTVALYSAILARFFKRTFGKYAYGKSIPDSLMVLPPDKQKHLIYGMWKGDGYINLDRDGARAGFVTVSYKIAHQMKVLLLRQGIIPSIYREKARIVKGVNHRESYRIHVGQRESLAKLCGILGAKFNPKSFAREKSWVDERYLYTAISDKKEYNYKGKVCNLEVEKAHSFTTEAFCVHNCGDVMWLYIRVGKNQKGKEIIKDIKFETFGCVAAIATSSVITDMAKGKTLEDAVDINKQDIVKELGGLPPVKLHCSVLAADALLEAVYDYLSRNERKIPADLEAKHQKIKTEKDEIEKRYKDWINIEEGIQKKRC